MVNICKGIILSDTRREVNFVKNFIPKNYFVFQDSDLEQPLHQDEHFTSKSCKLLVLQSENICKNCHTENIKFKNEVNLERLFLTASDKLNAPVKLPSPNRIELSQQKRL